MERRDGELEKKQRVRKWEVGLSKAHYITAKIVNTKTELSENFILTKGSLVHRH